MNAPAHFQPKADLLRYEAMVTAIAECARVDEAKDIIDKAKALEAYYRQARNLEAERMAANVRLRAEVRAGELLKELARAETASGGDTGANQHGPRLAASAPTTPPASPYATTLAENGMSRQTAGRLQAIASVPKEVIEAALAEERVPSATAVVARNKLREAGVSLPQIDDDALWL